MELRIPISFDNNTSSDLIDLRMSSQRLKLKPRSVQVPHAISFQCLRLLRI